MSKKKVKPNIYKVYKPKELTKRLKYFNKFLSVKLDSKANYKTDSKRIKKVETGTHNTLMKINCVLAGVPIKDYKVSTKKRIEKVKKFTEKSNLDYSTKQYDTSSIMFRRKFATLVTCNILRDEDKIIDKITKPYKKSKYYTKYRLIKDHEFFISYMNFILSIVGDYSYTSQFLFEMFYIINKKNILDLMKYQYKELNKEVSKGYYQKKKKSSKFLSDFFNMTLSLSTGVSTYKPFKEKDFKGCTIEDDLKDQIRSLGKRILKHKISNMFKIYIQCNPKIKTMYIKEVKIDNDMAMVVGLLAISFTGYMFHDQEYRNIARELLRRPWIVNPEENEKIK